MLVFFIILITLILIGILIYLSGISVKIDNFEIEKKEKIKVQSFKINIYFLLFNRFKVLKLQIKKKTLEKINFNKILDKFKNKSIRQDRDIVKDYLKQLDIKTYELKVKAKFGLNNAVLLAYLVAIIDIALSIIFARISNSFNKEKFSYIIEPAQTEKFSLKISINCIINVKIANIINILFMNRSEDNDGASNRGFNGNSHEQYSRYGRRKYYYRSTD